MITGSWTRRLLVALVVITSTDPVFAEQCGSALLSEVDAPAVLDGIDLSAPSVVRFWEAGAAGSNRSDVGCLAGCTAASGPLCATGGDCIALTGVSWLNATCAVQGRLPLRTVFLVEQTTTDSGGRWAAINFGRNTTNANTDLDAKAANVCGGCASQLSPYVGGGGQPTVTGSSTSGGNLVVNLSWSAPPSVAQALSDGADLVTAYGVHYRTDTGSPPASTGERDGWILVLDAAADGLAHGGFSTDTTATVEVPLLDLEETVTFAIGLSFDGSGDPLSDADTLASSFLSAASDPLIAPTGCGEPNHLVLEQQTVDDTQELIGCLTVTAGNGFSVGATGVLSLKAGQSIRLQDGFSVAAGGRLALVIDPALGQ